MACGICGQPGHNRRTCSGVQSYSNPNISFQSYSTSNTNYNLRSFQQRESISFTPVRTVHCGICGKAGHNRTTCQSRIEHHSSPRNIPLLLPSYRSGIQPTLDTTSSTTFSTSSYHCGECGKTGHNRRTCPTNSVSTTSSQFQRNEEGNRTRKSSVLSLEKTVLSPSLKVEKANNSFANSVQDYKNSIQISTKLSPRTFHCGGVAGHNIRTCPSLIQSKEKGNRIGTTTLKKLTESFSLVTSSRTVHRGICRASGHNRRTCPLLIAQEKTTRNNEISIINSEELPEANEQTPAPRTVYCGACGASGHNRRTCPILTASSPRKVTVIHCGECGMFGHNRRTCPTLKNLLELSNSSQTKQIDGSIINCSQSKMPAHKSSTFQASKSTTPNTSSSLTCAAVKPKNIDKNLNIQVDLKNPKLSDIFDEISKVLVELNKIVEDEDYRKELMKNNSQKNSDSYEEQQRCLNEEAQTRLEKGPTPKDTSGYVYFLTLKDTEKEEDICKIGISINPPRRVKQPERNNVEKYELEAYIPTPLVRLTDSVMKIVLKEWNISPPRDIKDGKTEFYKGSVDYFASMVGHVVDLVKANYVSGVDDG